MGQVIDTRTQTTKTNHEMNGNDKLFSSSGDESGLQNVYQEMNSDFVKSRELINTSADLCTDTNTGKQAIQTCNGTSPGASNQLQAEQIKTSHESYQEEQQLCAGEILDDNATMETINVLKSPTDSNDDPPVSELQHSMDWSEKKRHFSLTKHQSEDSLSSELSSISRHSFSSYLHAREYDAEEILQRLGFAGCDSSLNVPARFLNDNSLVSSQVASPTNRGLVQRSEIEKTEDDVFFDVASRTSFESSWSDSSLGRLPSRFSSSISRLSSVSSISEPEDNQSDIPAIVEPDKEQDDGFDLMRHLRLSRGQHDKGFLEPVTEELEISSVGSGSARTKVSAQHDSFDSIGNISVTTKIYVQTEESISEEHEERDRTNTITLETNINNSLSKEKLIENTNQIKTVQSELEASPANKLHLNSLKNSLALRIAQESFELEEIATSEENLDKIEENIPKTNIRTKKHLKRDHSDDSSGFSEDDAVELSRKILRPENLEVSTNGADEVAAPKEQAVKMDLLVPLEFSTPKDDAAARRSSFSKRSSWSTSKQKRVVFEDETYQKCRSFEDVRINPAPRNVDFKSQSLDISSVPFSNRNSSDTFKDVQTSGSSPSHSFDIAVSCPNKVTSDDGDVEPSLDENKNLSDLTVDKDEAVTRTRTFSENTAIRNIKSFMSSLLSIRSKLKKNPKSERLQIVPKSSETESNNSEVLPLGGADVAVVCSTLEKEADSKKQTHTTPSLALNSCQKSSHYELSSFEEDLQKYRSTFIAMELISTSQDKYYTRKLQARFAWDILFIRRLRSHIKEELDELQSNLYYATRLPIGAQSQMASLLKLQSGLRENLLTLANTTTHIALEMQPSMNTVQSFGMTQSIEDIENKIRDSVVEEIKSMFQFQISDLREKMKVKDSLIEELLEKMPQYKTSL